MNPKDKIGSRKAAMSCVPPRVLAEVGIGMTEGGLKYGAYNFRSAGIRTSVYYDATLRHLMAWMEGEDIDPDSGLSHITKAICSLIVLRDGLIQGNVTDDRPPRSDPFYAELNAKAAALVDRYAPTFGPNEGEWIEWGGGNCPVSAETMVAVRLRDGAKYSPSLARKYRWHHAVAGSEVSSGGDITFYRVARP
jgi:hypothetical protein